MFTPEWVNGDTRIKRSSFHFDNVARDLSRIIHQNFESCQPCTARVYASYDNKMTETNENQFLKWFTQSLQFYTTEKCQESQIVERLNDLIGEEIKLPIGTDNVTLTTTAATREEYDKYTLVFEDARSISFSCPLKLQCIDFQLLSTCPSVPLNYTDYTALMRSTEQLSKKRLINSLFNQPEKKGNGTTNTGTDTTIMGNGATNKGNGATNNGNGATNKGNGATNTRKGTTIKGNGATNMGNGGINKVDGAPNTGNSTINTDEFKVQACWETYLSLLPKKKNRGSSSVPMKMFFFVVVMVSIKFSA